MNHFSIKLWHAMKSEFYTIGNDQLNGWTEKKLQSTSQRQTVTKKGHGHCSVVCCLSDSLQFFESWQNHYIWEVCSANWWDAPKTAMPEASIGQQKGSNSYLQENPIARCTTNTPKVEWIGLWCFASFTMFTWRLTNWLLLLQTSRQLFAGKTLPQWTGCRKCFSRVHQILKHGFLCYRDKQISHWQTCWL